MHESPHLSTRQYARIVDGWVREIGLDAASYGTHTLRRTPRRSRHVEFDTASGGLTKQGPPANVAKHKQ
jgi:hypothetical protein